MSLLWQKKQRLIAKIEQQRADLIQYNGQWQCKAVLIDHRYQQVKRLYRTIATTATIIGLVRLLKKPVASDNVITGSNSPLKKKTFPIVLQLIKLFSQLVI